MITVVKQNPRGEPKIQYQGEILERLASGVIIQAYWSQAAKNLGYTTFEPGDRFIEYYYTNRWYNIFDIADANGVRKGRYCNVAEPAVLFDERIEQVDLLLDVWVNPHGAVRVLDEDEFAADTMLTNEQRSGAKQGLQALLELIATRQDVFALVEA
nr:DUF402 domain-containing protein [Ktedonobacteraceae bacterium]